LLFADWHIKKRIWDSGYEPNNLLICDLRTFKKFAWPPLVKGKRQEVSLIIWKVQPTLPLVPHHVYELFLLGLDVRGQVKGLAHDLGKGHALPQLVGQVHQVPVVVPT
jgi:hypothetical protein